MNWQNALPIALSQEEQIILLEAQSGEARHKILQQWLEQRQERATVSFLLSCNRAEGGPWAGLQDWLEAVVTEAEISAPALLAQHKYELISVLPTLQRSLVIQNPKLDNLSSGSEKRYYPKEQAYWIVNGLVDFLSTWYQDRAASVTIVCDRYDHASSLVRHFFAELMRRCGQSLNLVLLTAVNPGCSEVVTKQFAKGLKYYVQLDLSNETETIRLPQLAQQVEQLEVKVKDDLLELELHLPELIYGCSQIQAWDKVLSYRIKACEMFAQRGFYEDALAYGEAALRQLEQKHDLEKSWQLCKSLYVCYTLLEQPLPALALVEKLESQTDNPNYLCSIYYMLSMLHARFLPETDLVKAEAYLEQGLREISQVDLSDDVKQFLTAMNRNGLALIRHRQGRPQDAIELCRSCYQNLDAQNLLYRATLLFNISQVYTHLENYEEAIASLTDAVALDPNASEYYNDRGNFYMKLDRVEDAIHDYLRAIELSPPCWEVWSNLGHCYRRLDNPEAAIRAYSKAIDLEPTQFPLFIARAETFELLDQAELALHDYDSALTLSPDEPLLFANRAILHYDLGNPASAVEDLSRAIALSPDTADLYQNRAIALSSLGQTDAAIRDLRTYLQLNPEASDREAVESQLLSLL